MRSRGHQSEHMFCQEDGEEIGQGSARDGGEEQMTARLNDIT